MALTTLNNNSLHAITDGSALKNATGTILQTKYTQVSAGSSHVSSSNLSSTIVTPLSVTITPSTTSSVIRLSAMVSGEWSAAGPAWDSTWFFMRDSTKLSCPADGSKNVGILMGTSICFTGSDVASTPEQAYYSYVDSPASTSAITYKVAFAENGTRTWFLNRTFNNADAAGHERGVSFIMAQEIAG